MSAFYDFLLGSPWGYQNQLCWVSHTSHFFWISQPLWPSCSWSPGRTV